MKNQPGIAEALTMEMCEPWHRDLILGMLTSCTDLDKWSSSIALTYSHSGTLEVTALIVAMRAEVARLTAENPGAPRSDPTIGGDDYLAIVERQRAEALATIERVKALAVSWEVPSPGVSDLAASRSLRGDHGLTRSLAVAEVYARALRAALDPEDLSPRGQADAEMEETS